MLKSYTTLAGARRAAPGQPVLRVLSDGLDDIFIVGFSVANTVIYAIPAKSPMADGSIEWMELATRANAPHERGDR